jgi:glycosyltransferase involved in cell wall biosynthesis
MHALLTSAIDLFAWTALVYAGLCAAYLLIITTAAWFYKPKMQPGAPALRMTVVIPAHNEGIGIVRTISSIQRADYSATALTICVIADNCTDHTAASAATAGAMVFERFDPVNIGKGHAFDWFLRQHFATYASSDAVVFIDADTIVERSFFKIVSATLAIPGTQIVQGFYGVLNARENWRTRVAMVALNAFNHVLAAGHCVLGSGAGLRGNGMAFRTDLVRRYGWPAHSGVEDAEFGLRLLVDGIRISYAPGAIVWADMPVKSRQAQIQRLRWEGNRGRLRTVFTPRLIDSFFKTRRSSLLDAVLALHVPPLSKMVIADMLACGGAFIIGGSGACAASLLLLLAPLWYACSGMLLRRSSARDWLAFLSVPLFLFWKILLYVKILAGLRPGKWQRTPRKSELHDRGSEVQRPASKIADSGKIPVTEKRAAGNI